MARLRRTSVDSKEKLRRLADEELMELVAGNDADAFEVVLERHADAAFALAYRICGRRPAAEDIAQEAFLSVWRSGARYDRARGSVRTWTLGIVHNRAVDSLRRSSVHERRRVSDEGIEDTLEAPERTESQAVEKATSREIRGALGELPSEQRKVIELAYFGGFTHVEIASMIGTPVGTVKGRMRLGLRKLRDRLQDWEAVAHESA
ncbi:MAG TPA: RNA polymerase sigma factor [Solirubrobacteraceae bacterium]|jgi:RNA polymerase sigma-70 factor (ECF subfamily)|nr:RNA polymerase sigma factor [Solirubrobacteraceae bacterium]